MAKLPGDFERPIAVGWLVDNATIVGGPVARAGDFLIWIPTRIQCLHLESNGCDEDSCLP